MSRFRKINRRTVLKGVGASMALPLLEIMPTTAIAAKAKGAAAPVRMAFCFVPNGVNMDAWMPSGDGADYKLGPTLAPLAKMRDQLTVISHLAHDKARSNGDGPGDHARSSATFLTGTQALKTAGRDIRAGISVDQVAAQKVGDRTALPSLELGCSAGRQAGGCDSGYSCAYSSNISWRSPGQPTGKDINPRSVFTRLFGDPNQAAAKRENARQNMLRRSVLDLVHEDAKSLRRTVGASDQQKLDEYLESVREIEQRIQASERSTDRGAPDGVAPPQGIPGEFGEHIRLMMDMMAVAFQTDRTRIATFMLENEGSGRSYPHIGVRDNHHALSHHQKNDAKLDKIAKIDRFHVEQFAYLLDRLSKIKEGDSNVLDNSMIVYGGAIGDGNRHNHLDLPVVLAGRGGGTITPGRHIRAPRNTPMSNLFLSMLDRMGVEVERFGDSTGRFDKLTA